ncbi:MAG: hypothetical protein J7J14_05870, partial [Thermotogaceae bacterium]|nr:hypothetical protein [Thermotogaceae bacterium]
FIDDIKVLLEKNLCEKYCIVNDKNVEPWDASFRDRALVVEEAILRSAEIGKRADITDEI